MAKHPMSRTAMKRDAQESLMWGIGNVLGYFEEGRAPIGWHDWTDEQRREYWDVMKREADRVARLFGYAEAWIN